MFELKVTGFKTKAQVEAFIDWYSGQGEQDACIWFECRKSDGDIDVDRMLTNCKETYPVKWVDNIALMKIEPK